MITYQTTIQKFLKKGEKSGWSFIVISEAQVDKLSPGNRVSFRVKGKLDDLAIQQVAVLPMGDGSFILPINATMRKQLIKKAGDKIKVEIQVDHRPLKLSDDFISCLQDEPRAMEHFKTLNKSHQQYFSKWIESAKTETTKAKRITMAVIALGQGQGYPEMIRANKGKN